MFCLIKWVCLWYQFTRIKRKEKQGENLATRGLMELKNLEFGVNYDSERGEAVTSRVYSGN